MHLPRTASSLRALAILSLLSLGACASANGSQQDTGTSTAQSASAVEGARAQWAKAALGAYEYRVSLQGISFQFSVTEVRVQDGKVVRAVDVTPRFDGRPPVPVAVDPARATTMAWLNDWIDAHKVVPGDGTELSYDPVYGYPSHVLFRGGSESDRIEVTDFHVLP